MFTNYYFVPCRGPVDESKRVLRDVGRDTVEKGKYDMNEYFQKSMFICRVTQIQFTSIHTHTHNQLILKRL